MKLETSDGGGRDEKAHCQARFPCLLLLCLIRSKHNLWMKFI